MTAGLQINQAAESSLPALAAANNAFAFKLLQQLAAERPGKSVFVSPYSAATALQMVANGAAGQTKLEMQRVLETSGLAANALNAASESAADLLNSPDPNVILSTANALWYRKDAKIKAGFVEANRKSFASAVKALDFGNASAAEAEINRWASDHTHGLINDIANGMIDPVYTDLVLANAIYFKGKWLDPFDVKLTKARRFHSADGPAKNLPMMKREDYFSYRKGTGYQAVRLPYLGGNLAMYVFLPDRGSSLSRLLLNMNGEKWRRVTMPGFSQQQGMVVLPRLKLENTLALKPTLQALGMKTAFNNKKLEPDADFSGMFSDSHHLTDVRQQACVEVSEEGTEAAAVTVVGYSLPCPAGVIPPIPFEMIVDRPFMFAIVDARSNLILFISLVNNL